MDTCAGEAGLPPLPQSLDDVRIGGLPPAAFYISDFITEHEEQSILAKVTFIPINTPIMPCPS